MNRWKLAIIATFLGIAAFGRAEAQYEAWDYDGTTLSIYFENDADELQFGVNGSGQLTLEAWDHYQSTYYYPPHTYVYQGTPLLPSDPVAVAIYLGEGPNWLHGSSVNFNMLVVMGGIDNEYLNGQGTGTMIVFGGDGHEDVECDYQSPCYLYEQGGDGVFNGSFSGYSYFHPGLGGGGFAFHDNLPAEVILPVGDTGGVIGGWDSNSHTTYRLVAGSTGKGVLNIVDTGGTDSFYKHGYDFDVVDNVIVSDHFTGTFVGWDKIENVYSNPEPSSAVLAIVAVCGLCMIRIRGSGVA